MILKRFQKEAVRQLLEAMHGRGRDIVLKSCTGSGKTIILTHFMAEYCRENSGTVFVWLTPGKGNLEEQSCGKMRAYIPASRPLLLDDVMAEGFHEGDFCFINWEKLTKKDNQALREGERINFPERVRDALDAGLQFVAVVDESHQNDTIRAKDILDCFHAQKIIRCSATPRKARDAKLIEIPEEDVIAEGLIKKALIINEDFAQNISTGDQTAYLLGKALEKQRRLHREYLQRGKQIHPLIIVQIPNRSQELEREVEEYLQSRGMTCDNGRLAVWLAGRKVNLEGIEEPNSAVAVVIIKQAVATGWDCPRAAILVKLRDNMNEIFEIQTIGRIRRMPEAVHYESDLLDNCYLYTMDEKFTAGVRRHLGYSALDGAELSLKPEYYGICLQGEQKTMIPISRDPRQALQAIYEWLQKEYKLGTRTGENHSRLEAAGYLFDTNIRSYTISGRVITLDEVAEAKNQGMNVITVTEPLDTHRHGREFQHQVAEIGRSVDLAYEQMRAILRKLFDGSVRDSHKLLLLSPREVYSFVLNNAAALKKAVRCAMAQMLQQPLLTTTAKTTVDFFLPRTCLFTYDSAEKAQWELSKNVYQGYRASAQVRSSSEKKFEKYCQDSSQVEWFYKNGDKGAEYFSIVYEDAFGRQRSFYPDYLVGVRGEIWIIETKGGFTRTGKSEDIDPFSERKFYVLRDYLKRYRLQGGFVREDKKSQELCICTERFCEDVSSADWKVLAELF